MKDELKLYQFLYNGCTLESDCKTMSIHRTKEGAIKAMENHKIQNKKEFDEDHTEEIRIQTSDMLRKEGVDEEIIEHGYKMAKEDAKEWPHDWQYWCVKSIRVQE